MQDAGEVSREAYLKAVRQAREAVEQNKFIERDRIEQAVDHIHKETEKNWHVVVGEIESIGTRLTETAKSAWNALTKFFDKKQWTHILHNSRWILPEIMRRQCRVPTAL